MRRFSILLVLLLSVNTIFGQTSTDGLVAYYPFNGDASDESGNNLHGTINGATLTANRFGEENQAYYFYNANITVPEFPMPAKELTISLWTNTEIERKQMVFKQLSDDTNRVAASIHYPNTGGVFTYWDFSNTTEGRIYDQVPAANLNEWQHYVFTVSEKSQIMEVYLNNVKVISGTSAVALQDSVFTLAIGGAAYPISGGLYYRGSIDEFRVYDRVLSASEIQALYIEYDFFVDFQCIGGGSIKGDTHQRLWENEDADTVIAIPAENKFFVHWEAGDGSIISTNDTLLLNNIISDTNIYAVFKPIPMPEPGLVAYYPFSGDAEDVSGNELHGIVNGATLTTDRLDSTNQAYYFDGNDNITIPEFPMPAKELSISLWAKTDEVKKQMLFKQLSDDTNHVSASIHYPTSEGVFTYWDFENDIDGRLSDTVSEARLLKWDHYVFIVSNSDKYMEVYLNNEKVIYDSIATSLQDSVFTFSIGGSDYAIPGGLFFKGSIDEFKVYNKAISEDKILELYKAGFDYLVEFSSTGEGTIVGPNYQVVQENTDADEVVALPAEDQRFVHWETKNGSIISTDASLVLSNITSDTTVYAVFESVLMPEPGLIAYYPFSGNARDISGNGLHATINGATLTTDRLSYTNQAYYFDGNDNLTIAEFPMPAKELSISLWAKTDEEKKQMVFKQLSDDTNRVAASIHYPNTGGIFTYWDFANTAEGRIFDTLKNSNLNKWEHYVFIVSNKANYMEVYLNNELLISGDTSAALQDSVFTLAIGGAEYNILGGLFFKGSIDEFKVYNYVITADKIQELFKMGYDNLVEFKINGDGYIDGAKYQGIQTNEDAETVIAIPNENSFFKHWEVKDGTVISTTATLTLENIVSDTSVTAVFEKVSTVNNLNVSEPKIYPNPANERVYIELSEPSIINIIDITGSVIKSVDKVKYKATIDLADFKSGLYFIRIQSEKGLITKQLLIK